ncbi:aminotransferase class I/II-fold pyridoxal phosphate-dependent enzyme [Terrabacter sp. NPDC080008]|uniref:MalY/PatB family protein n=1 Tax=Terrabacter sp. NPDC080008 TaxID=3155176 RepID=UPI003450DAB8
MSESESMPPILGVPLSDLRRCRTSVKWGVHPGDVIPMWIAEMDCSPCPAVVEAVGAAVGRGDTGYALTETYAAEVASFADAEWGWAFDPATTTRVADVLTGVTHLLRLLTDDGGPVVVSPPVYNAFYDVIAACGRQVVEAPLGPDFRLDLDRLDAVFAEVTAGGQRAAYLLSNPHNPTGTVHSPDELVALARVADAHGVRVVSDEIHGPLVLPGSTFTPYLSLPGTERGLTVTSASKAWNLAGLKAAIIVPGAEAVADLRRLHPFVTFGASHLGVIAQTAAYRDGRDWVHRLVGELDANRRLLGELVAEHLPGVRLVEPRSTYLAWLDLRELGLGDDPAAELVQRARVALSSGPTFGFGGHGHARLNFGTSPEIIREAIGRIAASVA